MDERLLGTSINLTLNVWWLIWQLFLMPDIVCRSYITLIYEKVWTGLTKRILLVKLLSPNSWARKPMNSHNIVFHVLPSLRIQPKFPSSQISPEQLSLIQLEEKWAIKVYNYKQPIQTQVKQNIPWHISGCFCTHIGSVIYQDLLFKRKLV